MTINLYDYWKERARKLAACSSQEESQHLDGSSKSNVDGHSCSEMPQDPSPRLPENFEGTDMRALMERLRALANQI